MKVNQLFERQHVFMTPSILLTPRRIILTKKKAKPETFRLFLTSSHLHSFLSCSDINHFLIQPIKRRQEALIAS